MRAIAIDQGTTSTRAYVGGPDGGGKIVCTRIHRQVFSQSGWVEHDPLELLENIKICLEAAGPADVIGLGNQGESCLAWDAQSGNPVSPIIVWQDRRTAGVIAGLKARGLEKTISAKSGLPLAPYFSAAKLGWILEHVPQARKLLSQGHLHLGTTDAFFLERLCGRFVTDVVTASRTGLLNLASLEWDRDLCRIFGVPAECLPEIQPVMSQFGTLKVCGRQTPISACIVDQQASLFGHGCRNPGDTKITFGTGAFVLALTDGPPPRDSMLLPSVAWQSAGELPRFALEGGVFSAGSALNWAKSLGLFASFGELDSFAEPCAITRNLAFVPALAGLGCPHWDGSAGGLWIGMTLGTTKADMVQSIIEGIAFRSAQMLGALAAHVPLGDEISIDGGMTTNPYFCQFLADVTQKQIIVFAERELTAAGLAQMALTGHENQGPRHKVQWRYAPKSDFAFEKEKFLLATEKSKDWNNGTDFLL